MARSSRMMRHTRSTTYDRDAGPACSSFQIQSLWFGPAAGELRSVVVELTAGVRLAARGPREKLCSMRWRKQGDTQGRDSLTARILARRHAAWTKTIGGASSRRFGEQAARRAFDSSSRHGSNDPVSRDESRSIRCFLDSRGDRSQQSKDGPLTHQDSVGSAGITSVRTLNSRVSEQRRQGGRLRLEMRRTNTTKTGGPVL